MRAIGENRIIEHEIVFQLGPEDGGTRVRSGFARYVRSGFARYARPPHHRANLRSHALAAEFFATNVEAITWGEFPEFDDFSFGPWTQVVAGPRVALRS